MSILVAVLLLIVAFLILAIDRLGDVRKDNAALRRVVSMYQWQAVRRCMRFAAHVKGYDPYNSHTVQARCFKLQAGSRS